ncbi:MAG: pantoate kinase [Candidatus Poribacteria bacterium]|nr:pantoate kinase [Candidatus Poribacteria bacterium]
MASAFAPGNISCVFKIIPHADPARMHSLGMGFTVREGIEVAVSEHPETKVLFNGEDINFPTVRAVVNRLTQDKEIAGLKVNLTSPLPLGCGFGLSGAAALATAYALNELIETHKENEELAMIAHVAEVENRTGLGDVCSQYHGGCLVKLKEGAPLVADKLPIPEQPIYYRYFGPIQTSEVLRNKEQTKRINRAADTALAALQRLTHTPSNPELFNACFAVAKQFSVESGLLSDKRVINTIAQIEALGGVASMIMLGNGVFSTHAFDGAIETQLSKNPVRLI